jgi:hypothetical protein
MYHKQLSTTLENFLFDTSKNTAFLFSTQTQIISYLSLVLSFSFLFDTSVSLEL